MNTPVQKKPCAPCQRMREKMIAALNFRLQRKQKVQPNAPKEQK